MTTRSGAGIGSPFYLPGGGIGMLERMKTGSVVSVKLTDAASSRPVTPPSDDELFFAAVSRDGHIAFSRGHEISDVVLITLK